MELRLAEKKFFHAVDRKIQNREHTKITLKTVRRQQKNFICNKNLTILFKNSWSLGKNRNLTRSLQKILNSSILFIIMCIC